MLRYMVAMPHGARPRGRPKAELSLTDDERTALERLARRRTSAQATALRARIVLASAEARPNTEVAVSLGVTAATVGKWRRRFVAERLDGLFDEPRPGAPRRISDEAVEAVIVKTLEEKPKDATHWSTRSMARAMGMSQTSISLIWRAFGLQPHRAESLKLSTDPLLVEKVRDVVGLYLDPPERAVVLCVDEKSQIQALARFQPILPMLPGTPERRSHDYVRHGTTSLFAGLDALTGKVIGAIHRRHRAIEFRQFLERIDAEVPDDLAVHLVLDSYATHKTPAIHRWLLRHPRFHLHLTPTGASWLNLVERWFAELTTKRIKRGAHTSVPDLERDIRGWIASWNEDPRPYVWVKTADQILESLARYCARISDSAH